MSFDEAMNAVRGGDRVRRSTWPLNMWLEYSPAGPVMRWQNGASAEYEIKKVDREAADWLLHMQ